LNGDGFGIFLGGVSFSTINDNIAEGNNDSGISSNGNSKNNTFINNTISGGTFGISYTHNSTFINTIMDLM
jgi:parallel beta-helix repeat protein